MHSTTKIMCSYASQGSSKCCFAQKISIASSSLVYLYCVLRALVYFSVYLELSTSDQITVMDVDAKGELGLHGRSDVRQHSCCIVTPDTEKQMKQRKGLATLRLLLRNHSCN